MLIRRNIAGIWFYSESRLLQKVAFQMKIYRRFLIFDALSTAHEQRSMTWSTVLVIKTPPYHCRCYGDWEWFELWLFGALEFIIFISLVVDLCSFIDPVNMAELDNGSGNISDNATYWDPDEEIRYRRYEIAAFVLMWIIFVVGIIGNGLLVFSVLVNAPMRTIPNMFLASLSIGDFFLLIVSVPSRAIVFIFQEWPFGEEAVGDGFCKMYEFVITLSLGVSIFTLTALTTDRFFAIVLPMKALRWSTRRRTITVAASIWLFSLLLAIPDLFSSGVVHRSEHMVSHCNIYLHFGTWYHYFRPIFQCVVFFVLPLIIIVILYVIIIKTLLKNEPMSPQISGITNHLGGLSAWSRQLKARKKVAKTVFAMVALFVVCWLPRYIYVLWYRFTDPDYDIYIHVFKIAGLCLSFIYSCINPLALYCISDDYKRYFNHYLCGCCCESRRLKNEGRRSSNNTILL